MNGECDERTPMHDLNKLYLRSTHENDFRGATVRGMVLARLPSIRTVSSCFCLYKYHHYEYHLLWGRSGVHALCSLLNIRLPPVPLRKSPISLGF